MEVIRFARGLVPLAAIALLGAPGVTGPPAAGAAGPWLPPPCPAGTPAATVAAGPAWYRLDAVLDGSGTLAGQRLTVGSVGGPSRRLDLPPESFASGPFRGRLLVGDDDGTRSRLRVVDVAAGCVTEVGRGADVIRGGVLAPDLVTVWEHRVDRRTRADLGLWRRPASGAADRMLAGLDPDDRHGRTFSTELRWTPVGRLMVTSCGELACRTRVVDPAGGVSRTVVGTGPVIGVADGRVVAYAPCPGLPCPILAIDPATGRRETLVDDGGPAAIGGLAEPVLVVERNGRLVAINVRGGTARVVAGGDGLAPVRGGSAAVAGVDLPDGAVLLAVAGRLGDPSTGRVLDPASATVTSIGEVRR